MAAIIGDFVSEPTRFNHAMIASPSSPSAASLQRQHQHQHQHQQPRPHEPPFRDASSSSSFSSSSFYPSSFSSARPPRQPTASATSTTTTTTATPPAQRPQRPSAFDAAKPSAWSPAASGPARDESHPAAAVAAGAAPATIAAALPFSRGVASRFPSPPSSSPTVAVDDANHVSMASQTPRDHVSSSASVIPQSYAVPSTTSNPANPATSASTLTRPGQQQPSPPSDDFQQTSGTLDRTQTPSSSQQRPQQADSLAGTSLPQQPRDIVNSSPSTQAVIHIRDLAHVQSLARADARAGLGAGTLNDPPLQQMKYEISGMPIGDIIEMVAALLTKITTTNDLQHDAMQRNVAHQQQANQSGDASGSSPPMSSLSHSVLAFHGKNVPAITILSYLSRIHRYCPTTYEVFLSLLVYFDRMTERVNERVTRNEEANRSSALARNATSQASRPRADQQPQRDVPMRDGGESDDLADESDSDLADDDDDDDDDEMEDSPEEPGRIVAPPPESPLPTGPATYFVVDSFNIHRLIIAGVTCASKFFSDVFYTNSRYAKVGGLPLAELNHLELQFLILNDFRLAVPVEDLEAYATMLVEFYAREVVGRAPTPRD